MRLGLSIGAVAGLFFIMAWLFLSGEPGEPRAAHGVASSSPSTVVSTPSFGSSGSGSGEAVRPLDSLDFAAEQSPSNAITEGSLGIRLRCVEHDGVTPAVHIAFDVVIRLFDATRVGTPEAYREIRQTMTTDGDGRFVVPTRGDATYVQVESVQDRRRRGSVALLENFGWASTKDITILLSPPTSTILGSLSDPSGRPLGGVKVRTAKRLGASDLFVDFREVMTSYDGSFQMQTEPGRYRFRLAVGELLSASDHDVLPHAEVPIALIATTPAQATQSGVVVDQDDLPLAHVHIVAHSNRTRASYEAQSDERGRFLLRADRAVLGELVRLEIKLNGKELLAGPERTTFGGEEVRFQLRSMPLLRIRCVDAETREGIEPVLFTALRIDGQPGPLAEPVAGGLRLAPGRYSIAAKERPPERYALAAQQIYEMRPEPGQELIIPMHRLHSRRLRVVDSLGRPIPDLHLRLLVPLDPTSPIQMLEPADSTGPFPMVGPQLRVRHSTLDAQGEAILFGNPTLRYALVLQHATFRDAGRKVVREVRIEDGMDPLTVVVDMTGALEGTCTPADQLGALGLSAPAAARLWLVSAELRDAPTAAHPSGTAGVYRPLSVDPAGRFAATGIQPGLYDILYEPPREGARQRVSILQDFAIRGGDSVDQVTLDFSPLLLSTMRLTVLFADEPARGQALYALRASDRAAFTATDRALIDGLGRAEFQLRPGTYRFAISSESTHASTELSAVVISAPIEVPAGAQLEPTLRFRTFAVTFECIDASSGQPIADEFIAVGLGLGTSQSIKTDAHGRFRIRHVESQPLSFWLLPLGTNPIRPTTLTPTPSAHPIPLRLSGR